MAPTTRLIAIGLGCAMVLGANAQDRFTSDNEFVPIGANALSIEPSARCKVEPREDGYYAVVVRSAQNIKRMEGQYADSALTIPHGPFIYYHPNGRIESAGSYDMGVKVGTWYTQDITGNARAERSYTGLVGEELLAEVGVISVARTRPDDGH